MSTNWMGVPIHTDAGCGVCWSLHLDTPPPPHACLCHGRTPLGWYRGMHYHTSDDGRFYTQHLALVFLSRGDIRTAGYLTVEGSWS